MITTVELENLAKLARIKLTEDDKASLVKEFDSILGYIDQLKKVDVSADASSRVGVVKNIFRPDIISADGAERDSTSKALLEEAPGREGNFVAVKKIL